MTEAQRNHNRNRHKYTKHNPYYATIRDVIMFRKDFERIPAKMNQDIIKAIDDEWEATKQMQDGDKILQCIKMRFIDNAYKVEGVALNLYVSEWQVKQWTSDFFYRVAKRAKLI